VSDEGNDGRAIVSVKRSDVAGTIDFALATNRPVGELASILGEAMGWDGPFQIFADPPGRDMRSTETLAEAGVWDGAMLVLRGPGDAPPTSPTTARAGSPYSWKRIDSG
jgi:WXG100 protein secretion system (Wss), protein YukD